MVTKSYWIIYIHWRWHGNSLTGQFINFHDREKNESRAEIKSKRASLELEEARGRRGETGKQWKWNTARGPPRGPDVPPTIAVLQVSALILEQHGSAPDCRSFVKRGFVIRRKIAIRRLRVVKVSLKHCQFCLDTFGRSSLKLPTEERRKKGKNVEKFCEKWVSSSSKNARIGSPVLVLSHARIIGDNSWNFYRKSRTVQLPV